MTMRQGSGRTRRGVRVAAAGFAVTLAATLTACSGGTSAPAASGGGTTAAAPQETKQPVPVAQSVQLQQTPANGAKDVNPAAPIRVSAVNGSLTGVKLTSSSGKTVAGRQDPGNHTWTADEPLGYGKTYTWAGTATGADNKPVPVGGSFTTVDPDRTVSGDINTGDGKTYGIAMPIKVDFSSAPKDRAAVERALDVETSPKTDGSWAWLDSTSVHWRPKTYWAPGTKVTVNAKLYGLAMGGGSYGKDDVSSHFTIGKAQIAKGNVKTHRFQVFDQTGKQVFDFPASFGLDSVLWRNTKSGTHVVMDKNATYNMNNPRGGYSNVFVRWAVRLSNNGEFTHAYPETTYEQGKENVSHGCVNLTTARAKEYYDFAQIGDPVEITGSRTQLNSSDGDYYDWAIDWNKWQSMSAL